MWSLQLFKIFIFQMYKIEERKKKSQNDLKRFQTVSPVKCIPTTNLVLILVQLKLSESQK